MAMRPILSYMTNIELYDNLASFEWNFGVFDDKTFEQEGYPNATKRDEGLALVCSALMRILYISCEKDENLWDNYGAYDISKDKEMMEFRKNLGFIDLNEED